MNGSKAWLSSPVVVEFVVVVVAVIIATPDFMNGCHSNEIRSSNINKRMRTE